MRSALLLPCALWGLIGGTPSLAALPKQQFLVADSMPIVSRGESGSVSFTATRAMTSILKHVTFYAPDGLVITGIGPGKTGNMPQCRVANALPANYVTCVAKIDGDAYFTFAPIHSIAVNFAVDPTSNVGLLTGTGRLEQRYDGVHDTSFGVNVQITFTIEDFGLRLASNARSATSIGGNPFLGSFNAAFMGWNAHAVASTASTASTASAAQLPSDTANTGATYVPGTPGERGSPYAAVGKLVAYDAVAPTSGTPADGQQGECTGVVVPSNGRNLVMTAAHCLLKIDPVTQQAGWRPRLAFCPGLTGARKTSSKLPDNPLGCPADDIYLAQIDPATKLPKVHMNAVWSNILATPMPSDDLQVAQYDLAFVELEPNAVTHKTVEQVHGGNGIVFNARRFADPGLARSVGYNRGGADLNVCDRAMVSTLTGIVPGTSNKAHTLVRKDVSGCHMNQGVSGGPWLMDDALAQARSTQVPAGLVLGVNAIGTAPGTPTGSAPPLWASTAAQDIDTQYTPIFRNWTADLYKAAGGVPPMPYAPQAR
jgi:hypothetical protein